MIGSHLVEISNLLVNSCLVSCQNDMWYIHNASATPNLHGRRHPCYYKSSRPFSLNKQPTTDRRRLSIQPRITNSNGTGAIVGRSADKSDVVRPACYSARRNSIGADSTTYYFNIFHRPSIPVPPADEGGRFVILQISLVFVLVSTAFDIGQTGRRRS